MAFNLDHFALEYSRSLATYDVITHFDRFYSPTALRMESDGTVFRGRIECEQRQKWWDDTFRILAQERRGPYLHFPNQFSYQIALRYRHKNAMIVRHVERVSVLYLSEKRITRETIFERVLN